MRAGIAAATLLLATSGFYGVSGRDALAEAGLADLSLGPVASLGSPFGHSAGVQAAMNARGETTLVFAEGEDEELLASSIHRVALSAAGVPGRPSVVASGPGDLSRPALAVAPAGRAAVAWFEETSTGDQYIHKIRALRVRDVLADGRLEPARTAWHPTPAFSGGQTGLTAVTDAAGDEVVAWLTQGQGSSYSVAVMVTSRKAGGGFAAPVVLSRNGTEVPPALAISPTGEATVAWTGPASQRVLAASWPAGQLAPMPTVLDEYTPSGLFGSFPRFRDLTVRSDASGDSLITWLSGLEPSRGRPQSVALRSAWRLAGAGFSSAQTVTSAGVEAREPAVALSPDGQGLLLWSEITSSGNGPVLNYALAKASQTVAAEGPLVPAVADRSSLAVQWLADGRALVFWNRSDKTVAAAWTPGNAPLVPSFALPVDEFTPVSMAAGAASDPLFAWIADSSPFGPPTSQVRYVTANGLDGAAHPVVASTLNLSRGGDLRRRRGQLVEIHCTEACRLSASGRLVEQKAFGTRLIRTIGTLKPARANLPANRDALVRLPASVRVIRAYCSELRSHQLGVEARLSVRGLKTGALQTITLGEALVTHRCPR
jgi:hypothetical protein